MRCLTLAVIAVTAGIVAPCFAEDSFTQTWHPLSESASAKIAADAPTYDECFRLGWVRGVHVERDEWDDFYQQCMEGEVPFESGMAVDSVKLEHGEHPPHS